jgi:hypothetical protein
MLFDKISIMEVVVREVDMKGDRAFPKPVETSHEVPG